MFPEISNLLPGITSVWEKWICYYLDSHYKEKCKPLSYKKNTELFCWSHRMTLIKFCKDIWAGSTFCSSTNCEPSHPVRCLWHVLKEQSRQIYFLFITSARSEPVWTMGCLDYVGCEGSLCLIKAMPSSLLDLSFEPHSGSHLTL